MVDVELLSERKNRVRKRPRDNLFAWTVFLLLLIGVVFACWIGSFYVFQHPENARSYQILRKLKKIDPPKRFEPTLAPNGRFYHAKDLLKLVEDKSDSELARMNLELLQAFIGNYSVKEMQVPYLMGRFSVIRSQALSKSDLLTSGYVALARSLDDPNLLIEQLYPAEKEYTGDLRQMLQPGVEIKLERTYDLSAVLHVEKWPNGVWQVTIVPLNYDSYGLGDGREVHLAPPLMPNLKGLLPVLDPPLEYETGKTAIANISKTQPTPAKEGKAAPVLARSGPTPDQSVLRVARALPVTGTPPPIPKSTPAGGTLVPLAKPSITPRVLAAIPLASPTPISEIPEATPMPTPKPVIASSAASTPPATSRWQTYRPGQMPRGHLVGMPDLEALAKSGGPNGTTYLQGSFVVKANDGNRALLRASSRLVNALGLGNTAQVIVEFSEGQAVPKTGAQVTRDSSRPFQITAVRRDSGGQIKVFVREVTEP